MLKRTCCLTGHRSLPVGSMQYISVLLERKIVALIEDGYTRFCAGGAAGFDTLAEMTVIRLRRDYPAIKLILVLPCARRALPDGDIGEMEFRAILELADEVTYTSHCYYDGCIERMGRAIVDMSHCCLCYFEGRDGGTAYTVGYARSAGLPVYNLADSVHGAD